jgi:hypothetical protein
MNLRGFSCDVCGKEHTFKGDVEVMPKGWTKWVGPLTTLFARPLHTCCKDCEIALKERMGKGTCNAPRLVDWNTWVRSEVDKRIVTNEEFLRGE